MKTPGAVYRVSGVSTTKESHTVSDVIRLKGLTVFGHYGVSPAEREVGQKIQLDIELHADLRAACQSDSLKDTVNYESVYAKVFDVVSGRKHRLLESLGEEICYHLLKDFPVAKVTISLRKPNLPFPNNLSYVEVCLTREAPI
ncbi:MAG: dihydroneopterin aldolase [Candidatus Latescibacterota bacterium]|nr:MAG: dihydroneopterin aldolase [Candidatus Latescibacterota bacterium]